MILENKINGTAPRTIPLKYIIWSSFKLNLFFALTKKLLIKPNRYTFAILVKKRIVNVTPKNIHEWVIWESDELYHSPWNTMIPIIRNSSPSAMSESKVKVLTEVCQLAFYML